MKLFRFLSIRGGPKFGRESLRSGIALAVRRALPVLKHRGKRLAEHLAREFA